MGNAVIEHWGLLGKRGEVREHSADPDLNDVENLEHVLAEPRANGFEPFPPDDHVTVVVEYPLKSRNSANDLARRHGVEDRVNELLGWTGLGVCDGGSIGSGTMEIFCIVVDAEVAMDVLRRNLTGAMTGGHSRIHAVAKA